MTPLAPPQVTTATTQTATGMSQSLRSPTAEGACVVAKVGATSDATATTSSLAWGLYETLSNLVDLRKQLPPLRSGRQMLHQISGDGINFGLPHMMGDRMLSTVAWSRIFVDQDVLVAFSTNREQPLTLYSIVASRFRSEGTG